MKRQELTALCKKYEHFETPQWAIDAILEKEELIGCVLDPCCGDGRLTKAAEELGYDITAMDIHNWGFQETWVKDFLTTTDIYDSILMNPPFSLATKFVEHSFKLGAEKIICFQRFAWYESKGRRDFWDKFPPARVWVCGDRATCWRYDLPKDDKGNRYDSETGRKLAGSSTAHAWFIFERGNTEEPRLGRIYK